MRTGLHRKAAGKRIGDLEYASAMLKELQRMMQANGEKTLAYLIEMAYVEACDRRRELYGLYQPAQPDSDLTTAA